MSLLGELTHVALLRAALASGKSEKDGKCFRGKDAEAWLVNTGSVVDAGAAAAFVKHILQEEIIRPVRTKGATYASEEQYVWNEASAWTEFVSSAKLANRDHIAKHAHRVTGTGASKQLTGKLLLLLDLPTLWFFDAKSHTLLGSFLLSNLRRYALQDQVLALHAGSRCGALEGWHYFNTHPDDKAVIPALQAAIKAHTDTIVSSTSARASRTSSSLGASSPHSAPSNTPPTLPPRHMSSTCGSPTLTPVPAPGGSTEFTPVVHGSNWRGSLPSGSKASASDEERARAHHSSSPLARAGACKMVSSPNRPRAGSAPVPMVPPPLPPQRGSSPLVAASPLRMHSLPPTHVPGSSTDPVTARPSLADPDISHASAALTHPMEENRNVLQLYSCLSRASGAGSGAGVGLSGVNSGGDEVAHQCHGETHDQCACMENASDGVFVEGPGSSVPAKVTRPRADSTGSCEMRLHCDKKPHCDLQANAQGSTGSLYARLKKSTSRSHLIENVPPKSNVPPSALVKEPHYTMLQPSVQPALVAAAAAEHVYTVVAPRPTFVEEEAMLRGGAGTDL
eukprot:m.55436 g.55436  ORF g.55436 m.55436 type:complete len:566 (-) comp11962_c0_seq6:38-1735(-)